MNIQKAKSLMVALSLIATPGLVLAQQTATEATPAVAQTQETPWLKVYFESGSAAISADQAETLDRAVRTFREGDPFVMIVAGGADKVGDPSQNLNLSLQRATAVATALNNRGIPIERLQVLGRGNSELQVATPDGVAEEENRVVEISWR
ncbi:OmpA family protein [Yoonia sediminilitoris]|uniref:OmpA family protein n=1 Tax=Yoonia sediminilitoris TaxID=1286148 RepID=A0A2T6KHE8_9RHOB|nr:OmpA family protein [Yoonia sediminilitoris]PUB14915.1 OmpA family protein [Yoonia sediminilitoris]RCW95632.1 OmpA family protein [Yoonia sediminilitoris]